MIDWDNRIRECDRKNWEREHVQILVNHWAITPESPWRKVWLWIDYSNFVRIRWNKGYTQEQERQLAVESWWQQQDEDDKWQELNQ